MRYHVKIIFMLTLRAFFSLSVILLIMFCIFLLPASLFSCLVESDILSVNPTDSVMACAIVLTIIALCDNVINHILKKDSRKSNIPTIKAYLTLLEKDYELVIGGQYIEKKDNSYMKEVSKIACGINKYRLIKVDDESKSIYFERKRRYGSEEKK